MDNFFQDLKYAVRALRRTPGVVAVIIVSLGLGIGANTTVYSWMEAFLFHPLPLVPAPDRLVNVRSAAPDGSDWSMSYPTYLDWRDNARAFEGIAVADMIQLSLRTDAQADRVWGMLVSGNYFDVAGVRPLLGRGFLPDEESNAAPVAVIGYGLWQRKFSGDSSVVGRSMMLNGQDVTIVGVAPARFGGTAVGLNFDLWTPVTLAPMLTGRNWLGERGSQWLDVIGRLRPGVTIEQARADLNDVAARVAETNPDPLTRHASVTALNTKGIQPILTPVFSALLAVTLLVLLIACANVANLMLARATARRKEISVRLAVGADRKRIVRQLLTESLVLALLAGLAGVLFAIWARDLMLVLIPATPFPVQGAIPLSYRTFLFALVVSLATALMFGLVPALRASRPDLLPALKDEANSAGPLRSRLRSVLVVAQVSLSLTSLIAAGLFLRSLQKAQAVDPGFADPDRLLLVSSDVSLAGYRDRAGPRMVDRLLERVRALPGVRQASVATMTPLGFGGSSSSAVRVEGYEPAKDENMSVELNLVSPGYFETMAIPLVAGRVIGESDRPGGLPVAVVNEAFVARYIRRAQPIGVRFNAGGEEWISIVGVVKNGKYHSLSEAPTPLIYQPIGQQWRDAFTLTVRTAGDPHAMVETVRRIYASLDPNLPFLDPRSMTENMGAALFANRMGGYLLGGFGLLALALSAIGIYSVVAYSVSRRIREIGLRVALGAGRRDVLGLVIGQSMKLVMAGLAMGLAFGLVVGRLVQSQLFGISPNDPVTFASIALLLGSIGLAASWIPARRAARIDPLVALKSE
jgi:predicted permease